jgi:hypothetical protein
MWNIFNFYGNPKASHAYKLIAVWFNVHSSYYEVTSIMQIKIVKLRYVVMFENLVDYICN